MSKRSKFQSRLGFSPCFDPDGTAPDVGDDGVSIPSWVFSLLRPERRGWTPSSTCFNPVLGFLPASTSLGQRDANAGTGFNPVLGFLPASTSAHMRIGNCISVVSIPSWVFSLLRPSRPTSAGASSTVSIPSWFFSLLRLRPDRHSRQAGHSFNPVLGFLPASTISEHTLLSRRDRVSIPSWVFSLLRRLRRRGALTSQQPFQSRLGFSPCFDDTVTVGSAVSHVVSIPSWVFSLLRRPQTLRRRPRESVSIPSWVFSLLRRLERGAVAGFDVLFQSRLGFSPCFDPPAELTSTSCSIGFNPVLGFLPASTTAPFQSRPGRSSFNPVLGFLPASTWPRRFTGASNCFNPVLGFLPASTLGSGRH